MADDTPQSFGAAWITPEITARRRSAALLYADALGELEQLYETGKIALVPQGRRVLLRAIIASDVSELTAGVAYDARQAVAHEILAFGDGCDRWWEEQGVSRMSRPRVGDHCFVLSACLDRVSKTDRACRLWTCKIDDVSAVWNATVER